MLKGNGMRIAIAWGCSLLGFGVMFVVFLGLAMSTVPGQLNYGLAIGLAVLPLIALIASGQALFPTDGSQIKRNSVLRYIIPFLISLFSLVTLLFNLHPLLLALTVLLAGGAGFYRLRKRGRSHR